MTYYISTYIVTENIDVKKIKVKKNDFKFIIYKEQGRSKFY